MDATTPPRSGLLRDFLVSGVVAPLAGALAGGASGLLAAQHAAAPAGLQYWIRAGAVGGALGAVLDRWARAAFGIRETDDIGSTFGATFVTSLLGGILGGVVGGALDGSAVEILFGALWGILFGTGTCIGMAFVLGVPVRFLRLQKGIPGLVGLGAGAAAGWAAGMYYPAGREELAVVLLRMAAGGLGGLCGGFVGGLAARIAKRSSASNGTTAPRERALPTFLAALVLSGVAAGCLVVRSDLLIRIGQPGRSASVDLSPDGTQALVSRKEAGQAKGPDFENARLYDVRTGALLVTLAQRSVGLRFLPDGTQAAGSGRLWKLADGTVAEKMPDSEVETIGSSMSGQYNLRSRSTLEPRAMLPLPDGRSVLVALDFDGTTDDSFVALWDLEGHEIAARFPAHKGLSAALDLAPDGRHAVSTAEDGSLETWNIDPAAFQVLSRSGPSIRVSDRGTERVAAAAVAPDGGTVVGALDGIGNRDYALRVWDLRTRTETRRIAGHVGTVRAVRYLPDGRRLVSGSADGTVRVWDFGSGLELRRWHARGAVSHLAIDAAGTRVLAATELGAVRLFALD